MNYRKMVTKNDVPVKFPIVKNMVIGGRTREKILNCGDVVKCWWCGEHIKLGKKTTFMYDGFEYVFCPKCEKSTYSVYSLDRIVKRAKEKERIDD